MHSAMRWTKLNQILLCFFISNKKKRVFRVVLFFGRWAIQLNNLQLNWVIYLCWSIFCCCCFRPFFLSSSQYFDYMRLIIFFLLFKYMVMLPQWFIERRFTIYSHDKKKTQRGSIKTVQYFKWREIIFETICYCEKKSSVTSQ